MASIPLPALDVKPIQQPDPMGDVSKLLAMKSMMGQQQVQQQQLQADQLENQQRQMDLDSQKALQKAYKDANGDPDKTETLAAQYGAKPTALLDWRKAVTAQKLQALDLYTKQGDVAKQQADLIMGAHDTVAAAADKPTAYQQQLQALQARGVDTSRMPQQYPGDDTFKEMGLIVRTHTQLLDEAAKLAQTGKENAQAGEADAATDKARQESQWYQAHGGAPGVPIEAQQQADWLSKNPGKSPADYVVWKAKNSPTMLMQGSFGQANDPMIDMVGQGRVDLATALQRVAPGAKDAFMNQLNAKYPGYNQATFGVEKKATEAFTSGPQGQQLTAIDTARQHMQTFKDTAGALENGNFLLANKVGNAIGVQFGDDATTNFQIARAAFAGEVGKAFAGASVAEGDRKELLDKINAASSPAQLKGYADTADKLLEGKQSALKRSYEASQQAKPNFGETPAKTDTSTSSDAKKNDPFGIR
jgi:hypothetical protein